MNGLDLIHVGPTMTSEKLTDNHPHVSSNEDTPANSKRGNWSFAEKEGHKEGLYVSKANWRNRHPIQRVWFSTDSWDFSTTLEKCSNTSAPPYLLPQPYTTLWKLPTNRSFFKIQAQSSYLSLISFPSLYQTHFVHGEEQESMHSSLETPSLGCYHLCNRSHAH